MKFLIIGLGNFGRRLAEDLTDQGHDVIGVDINEHRVDDVKNRISLAYIMDSTEKSALAALPLDEIDHVVVAVGQSMDHSLRTVVALKELEVKNIYARALDKVHHSILSAMSVAHIIIPETYAARVFARSFHSSEDSIELI